MARPVTVTKELIAADPNGIAEAQTLGAAGDLTLDGALVIGGVGILDTQRRVIITSAADDSAVTFTVEGTDDTGNQIRDSFLGTNATIAQSSLDFKTVTKISASAATAGDVEAGTNGVGSTRWVGFDPHLTPPNIGFDVQKLSGTGNVSIELTSENFIEPAVQSAFAYRGDSTSPAAYPHPSLQNLSGSAQGSYTTTFSGWRLTVNSGTAPWQCIGTQAGVSGP